MGNTIYINNTTLVTAATSDHRYLVAKLNHIMVGLELFTFKWSFPEMDLLPYTEINIGNGTFVDNATSYAIAPGSPAEYESVAVAVTTGARIDGVNPGAYAFKLFKIDRVFDSTYDAGIEFENSTIVSNLTSMTTQYGGDGVFYVINVNGTRYGLKCWEYSNEYPFTTVQTQSAIDIKTLINISPTLNNQTPQTISTGSTNLNSKIKTYADVIRRIKSQIGYPIIEVEICDEQIMEYIDIAVEWYTKYAGYTEEFFAFDSTKYPRGHGYDLQEVLKTVYMSYASKNRSLSGNFIDYDMDGFRKVVNVWSFDQAEWTGTDALFSLEYIYAQQVYYSYMLGSYGFDLVTWETLKQFLDTRKRMFSSTPRVLFDPRTQRMRIIPEPDPTNPFIGIIGAYVERPIKDIIIERWVQQYALALTKIAVGHIRGKYSNVNLFGGGSIQGGDLTQQGISERDKLEEEILKSYGEMSPPLFFCG